MESFAGWAMTIPGATIESRKAKRRMVKYMLNPDWPGADMALYNFGCAMVIVNRTGVK